MNDIIKNKLKLLPEKPGCYLMKNSQGTIIYVGKAKVLKNRVKSYFTGSHNAKTTLLVSEIEDFEFIMTNSNLEAYLLEINLIIKHRPKYNIDLMDDKTYPYILLTKEDNPRLLVVRNTKIKGELFGPYPNVTAARKTVDLLNSLYPFRKCNKIPKKECLYYHINNCLAPCINNVNKEEYDEAIKKTRSFLKGDTSFALNELKAKMDEYSKKLEFEKAMECRDLINSINETTERQKISINDDIDRDVFNYYNDDKNICIYTLFMRNGRIVQNDCIVLELIDEPVEMLANYLIEFYDKSVKPKEIMLPTEIEDLASLLEVKIFVPKIGEKKQIMDMAYDNAKNTLLTKDELYKSKLERSVNALNELAILLNINYPRRIEMFDNSNTFGSYAVSGMVVYIDGKKAPSEYRKYKVNLEGIDDYGTTKEIIYRRYYRVLMDNLEKPDLIIMDGGKGHLEAVIEVLNSLNLNIPAIGLKKNRHHKTDRIIYNDKEYPISGIMYQLLSNMQEEVHRFAITFHRSLRDKGMFNSKLDNIKGLGEKSVQRIIDEFKTIENIKNAKEEDFERIGLKRFYNDVMDALKNK
ncbi:MAG: excinuclease ABC subunit UvrC [Acholeplasmatales bacterium]|nr:excinuclease ABC subunit UvrC [Acholeplasmatales bacterium]